MPITSACGDFSLSRSSCSPSRRSPASAAAGRRRASRPPAAPARTALRGYAYAGHQATAIAHGIRATITPTAQANVVAGHVAGWIGVGGPGQGANGQTMWLQVGVASIPDTPTMLYAEITRGGREPQFLQLLQNVRVGESHKVAVLEISGKPNWWRVWLDGKPATDPILLEGSTNRWRPIATGESWNGGQSVCNRFAFRFDGVAVAGSAGRRLAHVRARLPVPGPRLRRQAAEPVRARVRCPAATRRRTPSRRPRCSD